MFSRANLIALSTLVLGALLGYAAATGQLNPFALASSRPAKSTDPRPLEQGACCDGAHRQQFISVQDDKKDKDAKKPNILVIWGDDIGYWNISAYNRGLMGYRTPNIDRIAREGAIFTDHYGQQSCTAGRAAFITGQSPLRTGLLKVGLPAAKEGLSDKDRRLPSCASAEPTPPGNSARTISASSNRSRLRRVLRQPLSLER